MANPRMIYPAKLNDSASSLTAVSVSADAIVEAKLVSKNKSSKTIRSFIFFSSHLFKEYSNMYSEIREI